jgi:MFS superfamily sulfate permease-like transporter
VQIPHAVGWDADPEGDLNFLQSDGETTFSAILQATQNIDPSALLVSLSALAILVAWDRFLTPRGGVFKLVQGPLVAVAFGIGFQLLTTRIAPSWALSGEHLVDIPVAAGFSELGALFTFPDWSQLANPAIYMVAVTLAVVASLETLLCVEATDKMDPQKRVTPTNRELVAQGTGNVVSGLLGGLPVTQVIVRSSANIQSGARSKLSAIVHGVLLVVFVLALPQVLILIPLSVLASILFVVGYKLAKPELFISMLRLGPTQFVPFLVTILGMVFTDLLTGVMLGLTVATAVILYRNYDNSYFLHLEEEDAPGGRHRVTMRLSEEVTFLNRGAILHRLAEIPDGSDVILDMSRSVAIDHDVLEIIDDFKTGAEGRDLSIRLIGHPKPDFERHLDAA